MKNLQFILGSAQWGWTLEHDDVFRLLDAWLKTGASEIDAATNYPINKNAADFRKAESLLRAYIQAHGLQNTLKITMKIGALDNMRSPDVNLSPSFIRMIAEEYRRLFGDNLSGLMFHWDNRSQTDAISESVGALLDTCQEMQLRPGLSGIAHPEAYAAVLKPTNEHFDIELKHNVLQSDFDKYKPLQPVAARFLAYGINAGGIRLDGRYHDTSAFVSRGGDSTRFSTRLEAIKSKLPDWNTAGVRPPLMTMNHLGLVYAAEHPGIHAVILGVSSASQLHETFDFVRNLEVFDYSDVYRDLFILPA